MKRMFRKFVSILMIAALLCGMTLTAASAAGDARKCYTISAGNVTTYTNSGLTVRSGSIYPTDEISVITVTGRYCLVDYPTSKGTKRAYIPTSAILVGTSGPTKYATAQITTYRRPNTSVTYGYVSKGDAVVVLGTYGAYTQLKYPVSGGFKYAFVKSADAQKYLSDWKDPAPPTPAPSGSWRYPVSNVKVCGNDWSQYYSARASVGRPDHLGIDIKSNTGDTAIYAAADGTIARTGYNAANGNYVVIKHTLSGKTVYSFYAHLSSISRTSGTVTKGTKIGVIGTTGTSSTAVHLHFAIVDQLWSGSYYGYGPSFAGDKYTYQGVTYYNPHYVINYGKLP